MTRPHKQYKFRLIGGYWIDVLGDSKTLADILNEYEIVIDDRTQFARLIDYEKEIVIYYRAYNQAKVTIDIWKMQN